MVLAAATIGVVGVLTGLTGVGGVLLIPLLQAVAGLSVQASMATALCSFFFIGILAVVLQQRRQSLDWGPALPLALSAAVTSLLGVVVNAHAPVALLSLGQSVLVVFAGASALFPPRSGVALGFDPAQWRHKAILAGIGAVVGFLSGLTGAGGPVLSIPLMVSLGFPPLLSIAAGQVLQVAVAACGTVGNLFYGTVDYGVATWITGVQGLGLLVGIRLSRSVSPSRLRQLVACVCLLVGVYGCFRFLVVI